MRSQGGPWTEKSCGPREDPGTENIPRLRFGLVFGAGWREKVGEARAGEAGFEGVEAEALREVLEGADATDAIALGVERR